ncbi:MAG: hypothetical protein OEZ38_10740 [Gammaproteobacteria bacterium]|nr:hypothetical protein [Gammaproteobacteria bacterium]
MNNNTPRTRAAINILNRIDQGHDLGIILGMDIELALYQIDATLKVNPLIQPLREAFTFKDSGQQCIMNGKAFLDHLNETSAVEYPFGKSNLPEADEQQKQAISRQMDEVLARLDTACELVSSDNKPYKKNMENFVQYVKQLKNDKKS